MSVDSLIGDLWDKKAYAWLKHTHDFVTRDAHKNEKKRKMYRKKFWKKYFDDKIGFKVRTWVAETFLW